MTGKPCGAEYERTPGEYLYCQRGTGHRGKHRLRVTVAEWSDPEPVPPGCPACDGVAGTECRCPEPNWGCDVADPHGNYYCSLVADHDGQHACVEDGELLRSWTDPEPEPMVCEDCGAPATHEHPNDIRRVLMCANHAGSLCCRPLPEPEPVPESYVETLEARITEALSVMDGDYVAEDVRRALRGES